jgi:hypothetical protein
MKTHLLFSGVHIQRGLDLVDKLLEIKHHEPHALLQYISSQTFNSDLEGLSNGDLDFVKEVSIPFAEKPFQPISMKHESARVVDFEGLEWIGLPVDKSGTRPLLDPIDLCFTSGHCIYKIEFFISELYDLTLDINMRHRCTIMLNGTLLGGNLVYSLGVFRAGAKNGPDIGLFGGWAKYKLPAGSLALGSNVLVVIVESFGLVSFSNSESAAIRFK